jgi:iron complex transport system ATP-binding protein
MATTLLSLLDLRLCMGARALGPITLRVEAGEQIALLGPGGAGKSTLLRLIAGDLAPSSGRLSLDGRPLAQWRAGELLGRRALLPQRQGLAFGLSVERVVALGRAARSEPASRQRAIVREALTQAGAAHLAGLRLDSLSGAERAQVQLARVFAQAWETRAGLLLMDEGPAPLPTSHLDSLMRAAGDFARQRGHALVAVLHDLDLAFRRFERLWLLKGGRMLADCDTLPATLPLLEQLYDTPLRLQLDDRGMAMRIDHPARFAPSPPTPQ